MVVVSVHYRQDSGKAGTPGEGNCLFCRKPSRTGFVVCETYDEALARSFG